MTWMSTVACSNGFDVKKRHGTTNLVCGTKRESFGARLHPHHRVCLPLFSLAGASFTGRACVRLKADAKLHPPLSRPPAALLVHLLFQSTWAGYEVAVGKSLFRSVCGAGRGGSTTRSARIASRLLLTVSGRASLLILCQTRCLARLEQRGRCVSSCV